MTAIVRAPSTSASGSEVPARNLRGSAVGLAPQATTTLASGPASGWKLRGFSAFGDNDLVAWVELDGVPVRGIMARGSIVKVAQLYLPNPEAMVGVTVALKVRNEANLINGVSGAFEGTLFGV